MREVKAKDLMANPLNFREHPDDQKAALRGILQEVGIADVAVAYEREGELVLIDGHLRKGEVDQNQLIPTVILDVTEDEANKLLAAHDAIGSMATLDRAKVSSIAVMTAPTMKAAALKDMVIALDAGNMAPLKLLSKRQRARGTEEETVTRERCSTCNQVIRRTSKKQ